MSLMSQPVKLSDQLVLDARLTGEVAERSIAGQIEFWANLGRALEPLLDGRRALALQKSGKTKPVSAGLALVDTEEGRTRVKELLDSRPYPHYEPHPEKPGLLIRTDAKGRKTVGRFVGREFKRS
jgi:hypothetical protein